MRHTASGWTKKCWMGKKVIQVLASPGMEKNIGRMSVVTDAFFDEKGALHVHTEDGFWTPAVLLEVCNDVQE